jgi:hypothetical protein
MCDERGNQISSMNFLAENLISILIRRDGKDNSRTFDVKY